MILETCYDALEIHRNRKKTYAIFKQPHRVISTCSINGGLRDDLGVLLNHQSCESCNHQRAFTKKFISEPEEYHKAICLEENLDPGACASLGTAANMNYAAVEKMSFKDLTVVAVSTGGVEGNAGRAGDPAHYYESRGAFKHEDDLDRQPVPGTINIMLFINRTLTRGAMVRAIVTATEAKSAALQELAVNSRYSNAIATGTGTDQIGIASLLGDEIPLTSSGKHTKLGELIGRTVKKSVMKTLALQNKLTPEGQRSVKIHIERFGTDKKGMQQGIRQYLDRENAALLMNNFDSVDRDPLAVAAVAALVHVRDEFAWGILPQSCSKEIFSSFGAQIAASISGRMERMPAYRDQLLIHLKDDSDENMLELIFHSIAMGFEEKW
ncbi:MAG: adenosylcobinamide amidohydrolase [Desulfobacteraceae bacterium]|nr:adenosylcobinamide amidohydrolase [Desulfobacteraceae bacterium]